MSDALNSTNRTEQELKAFIQNASSIDDNQYPSVPESVYEGQVINPQSFFQSADISPFPGDFRTIKGTVTVANSAGNATANELRTGIQNAYGSSSFNATPMFGDIITLTNATGGALVGRFIVILSNDDAPGEATIEFTSDEKTRFALNLTTTTVAGLTDAFDQYLGIFDETGQKPKDEDTDEEELGNVNAPFRIKIINTYEPVSAGETLQIGTSSPNIAVKGGDIEPMPGLTASFSDASDSTFVPSDGTPKFVHIYAKYRINFTGTIGSRIANSITNEEIVFLESSSNNYKEGGEFNTLGTQYTHHQYIGNVALIRRGGRRFARITQVRSGKITGIQNFNSISTGTTTDSSGTDVSAKTKSGLREVILCLDGEPFATYILTGPLLEIT